MKNQRLRKFVAVAAAISIAAVVTACGSKDTSSDSGTNAADNSSADTVESAEKTVIKVGTAGSIPPFTYMDDNDELIGYDVDLLRAIFEKLPQYDLEFEATEFASITIGLDTGLYKIGACNFAYNDERAAKYIYSDPIFENQFVIAVQADNDTITSWDDIAGKTTEVGSGSNYATALEKWNESNPDAMADLNYTESDLATILSNVESGKFDFQLIDRTTLGSYNEEYGFNLKAIDLTDEQSGLIGTSPYSYYLLENTEEGEKLAEELNQALAEVIADGTAEEICQQYFNGNFVPNQD